MPNYQIGYRKPPAKTRFKKGQSGNPKGRPKGARNLRTLLSDLMSARIHVTENGRRRSISTQEALLKGMLADALRGDHKARTGILGLVLQLLQDDFAANASTPTAVEDTETIRRALARLRHQDKKG